MSLPITVIVLPIPLNGAGTVMKVMLNVGFIIYVDNVDRCW